MNSNISFTEIAMKLRFPAKYITNRIVPEVAHKTNLNGEIEFDGAEFRQWLMDNSIFTRQTKFVASNDVPEYQKVLADHNIPTVCPSVYMRTSLFHSIVNPFDFWDKDLLFQSDSRFNNSMTFIRAMYMCAGIKIRLSEKHIFFYAPAFKDVLEMKNGRYLFAKSSTPSQCVDIDSNTGKETLIQSPVLLPALDTDVFQAINYKPNAQATNEDLMNSIIDTLSERGMSMEDIQSAFNKTIQQRIAR